MKKTIILFSIFALLFSFQVKAQETTSDQETEKQNLDQTESNESEIEKEAIESSTENDPISTPTPIKAKMKAKNAQELREMIQNKKQEMEADLEQKREKVRSVYQNQNQVKEAVHAMLIMEDLLNGIGQRVSEIAQEFNHSIEKTIQSEEKIQTRNRMVKFFFGGNQKAAEKLDQEIGQNQLRLKELNNILSQYDGQEEVEKILEEKIQKIIEEQNRLQELVVREKQNKGLFGSILSWFKRN